MIVLNRFSFDLCRRFILRPYYLERESKENLALKNSVIIDVASCLPTIVLYSICRIFRQYREQYCRSIRLAQMHKLSAFLALVLYCIDAMMNSGLTTAAIVWASAGAGIAQVLVGMPRRDCSLFLWLFN